jgi:G:T/U-mismatch repair DNA glycosylase
MSSKHPFEPYIPKNAKSLIIGTIPPPRFCKKELQLKYSDVNFYYGSEDNHFWRIIDKLYNLELKFENTDEAIEQRKDFLDSINVGITDIVDSCIHKNNSASDKNLENINCKNLKELLKTNEQIDTLIYTSTFVKTLVNRYFKTYHHSIKNESRKFKLKIDIKDYDVIILYSPSPQALRGMKEDGTTTRKNQYENTFKKQAL